ncbi:MULTISPECIES: hypothetical protein [unclassified Mesotoga]|uniref:hypothetical protein n=1 Tax=unclassified Mesotoga TaxID=1184398 RepID=UPI000CCC4A54|nr:MULTISPECIES: hypothetical protein [unclassified Mesotoga]PNS41441.1 hypothetical protein RJ60_04890 [Mesotoga sp. B105.6.4]RAO96219.1 hypothetical protein M388_14855 [Mesotoga sp. Brook.08.YT.4.2.5.4.]RDI93573.1 hypothetical protein Q502_04945 [Mesotoga sp. Brook.08.YT.4.2.5.2.]
MVQARISFFETVASDKSGCRARAKKLSKSLETVFSVDGGPLTDNVVLNNEQLFLLLATDNVKLGTAS